jgi:PAS domain S-box-containing protein
MADTDEHFGLNYAEFARLIDHLHDEIVIYDRHYRIVYVNKACARHYGFSQAEMIGQDFQHFANENRCWNNSVLPSVYQLKKPLSTVQRTAMNTEILTIATPLLDAQGEVDYVLMNVRDLNTDAHVQRLQDIANQPDTLAEPSLQGLVHRSDAMQQVLQLAQQMCDSTSPCLILGETGSGKSLLAKYIHQHSPRRDAPFVVVNCASIPNDLFESELFGHKRGAFTGAMKDKTGLFAQAEGGTLFLDEISELPLAMQAKLLHAVQEREYRPVGANAMRQADVKLLTASNRDLFAMVHNGAFREDLYYRLTVFEIQLPPLRQRRDDLLPLVYFYLNHFNQRYEKLRHFSEEALTVMQTYNWPGNVRELAHVIERLVVTAQSDAITVHDLPASLYETHDFDRPVAVQPFANCDDLDKTLEQVEKRLIQAAVKQHGSSRQVAAALNISQSKATRLMRKHAD